MSAAVMVCDFDCMCLVGSGAEETGHGMGEVMHSPPASSTSASSATGGGGHMAACNDMQRHACNDMDQHEAAREMVHMLRAELQDTRALVRQHQYHHQQQQETAGKSLETTYELQQQVHQQHEELQSRWAEVKELRAEVQAAALASTSLTQQLHQLTLQHSKLQSRLQAGEQHAASVGEALDAAEREKTALTTDRDELRAGAKSQMALAAQETERLKKLLKVGSSCLVLLLLCCSCCFVPLVALVALCRSSMPHVACGTARACAMTDAVSDADAVLDAHGVSDACLLSPHLVLQIKSSFGALRHMGCLASVLLV